MHLIHPMMVRIGLPVLAVLIIVAHIIRRKIKYKGGVKAANTYFVKSLDVYKSRKALTLSYTNFAMRQGRPRLPVCMSDRRKLFQI